MKYQMKKIINSLLIATVLLVACGKDKEKQVEPLTTDQITSFVGIGKVMPEAGVLNLTVDEATKVTKLHKKLGDTIKKGTVLFETEAVTQQLQLQQAAASYKATKANNGINFAEIKQAQLKLAELKNQYQTSQRLYNQKAETKQKLIVDSLAYLQQQQIVKQLQEKQVAENARLKEQNIQVKAAKIDLASKKFTAAQDGILTVFDVQVGEILQPNVSFGELASNSELIIEAEIDEFYASELKKNQKVEITLVGQTSVIAKGLVSFVGLGLQNKSILYETIGEANDRRVRRFNVRITEGADKLLINQKVECKLLK